LDQDESRQRRTKPIIAIEIIGYLLIQAIVLLISQLTDRADTFGALIASIAVDWVFILANLMLFVSSTIVREEQVVVLIIYPFMQGANTLNLSDSMTTSGDVTALLGVMVFILSVVLLNFKKRSLDDLWPRQRDQKAQTRPPASPCPSHVPWVLATAIVAPGTVISLLYVASSPDMIEFSPLVAVMLLLGPVSAAVSILLSSRRVCAHGRKRNAVHNSLPRLVLPFATNLVMFLVLPVFLFEVVHVGGMDRSVIPLYGSLFVGSYYLAALFEVVRTAPSMLAVLHQYYHLS